jgi:orotate phosphoribosyltransferase
MSTWLKDQLVGLIQAHAISHGEVRLAGGSTSSYYIDFSKISLSHLGSIVVGTAVAEACQKMTLAAIGGPVLGACPIVTAAVMRMPGIRGFYIRKAGKEYAKRDLIEGLIKEGDNVVLVEDVTTSGQSLLKAANIVRDEFHCEVLKVFTMMDRQAGAEKLLTESGYDFESFVQLKDLDVGTS